VADTQYNVLVNYVTKTGQAKSEVDSISKSFTGLSDMAGGIARRIDGAFMSIARMGVAAVTAAGAAGIGALVYGVTRLNAEAESATISIAGMIQAGHGAETFSQAMSMSQSVIAAMRRDAAALPGEFEDLQRVFQGSLSGGLNAGKSVEQIEQFSGRMMAVSQMLNVDSQTAGRELAMMLDGRAGAHVVLFSRLRAQIGMTAREFNEATPQERFRRLSQALNGFDPAIRAFGNSWSAISSTTMDILKNTLRIASGPLFTRVKNELNEINNYLQSHQERLNEIVTNVGQRLAGAFDAVKEKTLFIKDHFGEIVGQAREMGERFGGAALVGRGALGLIANRGVAGAVGGALGGGAGVGGIAIAALMTPLVVAVADGSVSLRRFKADVDSLLTPLENSLKQLTTALEPLISKAGQLQFSWFERLVDNAKKVADAFGLVTSALTYAKDHIPEGMTHYMDTFWEEFRHGMGMAIQSLIYLIPGIGQVIGAVDLYRSWRAGRNGMSGRMMADEPDERVDAIAPFVQHALARNERRQQQVPPRGNLNVNVRIEQTVNDASDPQRLYLVTNRAIWDAVYRPTEMPKNQVMR